MERLPGPGVELPFTRATESPLLDVDNNFEDFHHQITVDKSARTSLPSPC